MAGNARQVINMANSIVGVSILSMPFCFKQSGLLLGVVLVLVTGFITKKTCMFLIRSAIMARRRSYEFLAFHVFGVSGKLFVEMCMILFLFGICISFYVVMGDIAPAIVARFMSIENSSSLRYTLLIGIAVLVILPLCLLRNIDNLASMSAFSIMFYFFLVVVIFWHAFPKLWDGTWIHVAELWRPAGALQILPILSLALACQSNVFEIYDSVPDPDVPKMRFVVNHAVNLCSALYISVGFLGYVAFVDKDFGGNIIMSFPDSGLTEGIKMFFAVSLAISFPLMIFPCRTSIHSLIYRRSNPSSYDLVGNYMPESRFKAITLGILLSSLVLGILIPSIELVLGLLGSTMGMLIASILPSLLFIKVNSKASTERLLAQAIMLMGIMLIVTGTYLNLAHIREVQQLPLSPTEAVKTNMDPQVPKIIDVGEGAKEEDKGLPVIGAEDTATRKEPVAPEPPPEEDGSLKKEKVLTEEKVVEKNPGKEEEKNIKGGSISNGKSKDKDTKEENKENIENIKNGDTLHPDAIQKEELEHEEEKDKVQDEKDIEKKQAEILEKMEVQHQEQQQILEEQKKILKELKDHKLKQEEEEAKKQEEEKAKNVGAGNVILAQDPQKIINPGLQAAVPVGIDPLVDSQPKPLVNQDQLSLKALPMHQGDSKVYHSNKGVSLDSPSAKAPDLNAVPLAVGDLNQNQKIGKEPLAVSIPTVQQDILAKVNNPLGLDPQLPMVYYHANSPNIVGNAPLSNNVNNIPPGIAPVANQAPAVAAAGNYAAKSGPDNILAQAEVNDAGNPDAPVVSISGQQPVGNAHIQPLQPIHAQPLQANVPVQAEQAYIQLQPVQAFAQIQPVKPMISDQSPQMAAQAVMEDKPAQALVVGQPMPAVVPGPNAEAIVHGPPAQAGVPVQPAQAPIPRQSAQPAQAPIPGQSEQAMVSGSIHPVHVAIPEQFAQAAVPGPPAQVLAPVQYLQVAGPGQSGQAILLNQPVGGIAPVQSVQGNLLIKTPQESVPILYNPVNAAGQIIPGANNPDQPSVVGIPGEGVAGALDINKPVFGANSANLPSSVLQFEDKTKFDAGKSKGSLKIEKKSSVIKEKQKKDSVSEKTKETLSNLTNTLQAQHLKKTEKVDSKREKLSVKETVKGDISGSGKSRKKTQHDEERRKREVDDYSNYDLPPSEILKELKWKEFGDVAYDTRHLLWMGRSRRKKRTKGRDEDYYWDET